MLQYDFQRSPAYWILSTAHALEVEFNEVLAPLGITFRQLEVLALLAIEGTPSQVEVARRMGVEAPTLAGIVARMETAGWIAREYCPSDRRKKLLRATERASTIWEQAIERAHQVREQLMRGLTAGQIEELIRLLETISNNLSAGLSADGKVDVEAQHVSS